MTEQQAYYFLQKFFPLKNILADLQLVTFLLKEKKSFLARGHVHHAHQQETDDNDSGMENYYDYNICILITLLEQVSFTLIFHHAL